MIFIRDVINDQVSEVIMTLYFILCKLIFLKLILNNYTYLLMIYLTLNLKLLPIILCFILYFFFKNI